MSSLALCWVRGQYTVPRPWSQVWAPALGRSAPRLSVTGLPVLKLGRLTAHRGSDDVHVGFISCPHYLIRQGSARSLRWVKLESIGLCKACSPLKYASLTGLKPKSEVPALHLKCWSCPGERRRDHFLSVSVETPSARALLFRATARHNRGSRRTAVLIGV